MTDTPRLTDAEIKNFAHEYRWQLPETAKKIIRHLAAERDQLRADLAEAREAVKEARNAHKIATAWTAYDDPNNDAMRATLKTALPHMIAQPVAKSATDDKRLAAIAACRTAVIVTDDRDGSQCMTAEDRAFQKIADYLESLAP